MAQNLRNISTEDLEQELANRQQAKNLKDSIKPVAFDELRHTKFVKQIQAIVDDDIAGEGKDSDHWAYEAAVMYVFGDDIFNKLNKIIR